MTLRDTCIAAHSRRAPAEVTVYDYEGCCYEALLSEIDADMAIAHGCVPSWDEASKGYRQRLQQRMWFGLVVQHQTRDPYYYKGIIILLASVSRGREKSDHMKVLGHD